MLKRLPARKDITPVFAVTTFLLYAWTIYYFLWGIRSYSYYLQIGEIFAVFSYLIVKSFLESLLLLFALLGVAFFLPSRFFRDRFVSRGTMAAIVLAGSVMFFWRRFANVGLSQANSIFVWTVVTLIAVVLLSYLAGKLEFLARFLALISDRFIIFLYILMPLSFVAFVIVLFRNIF